MAPATAKRLADVLKIGNLKDIPQATLVREGYCTTVELNELFAGRLFQHDQAQIASNGVRVIEEDAIGVQIPEPLETLPRAIRYS
jgi:hypothetical protein